MTEPIYIACPDNTDLRYLPASEADGYRQNGWYVAGPFHATPGTDDNAREKWTPPTP